jgi:predicted nucleic acid-binding Zn ribbon protein
MAELEPDEQLRRAAEALTAARAAARARGARPVGRGKPTSSAPAPPGASAASGDTPVGAGSADPEAAARAALPTGQQGNAPGRESVISEQMKPDAAHLAVPGSASGKQVRPGPAGGRVGARPGFAVQPRREDPVPLSSAISGLLDAEGWALSAATGSVFGRWAEIVGTDLAGHTRPERLSDGELTVVADSTAWATQVRLLAAQLVLRLNQELGDGTVQRVKVRGPALPDRKPGQWRVRGGRGPRDTYG